LGVGKNTLHRAVSLRQHCFLVVSLSGFCKPWLRCSRTMVFCRRTSTSEDRQCLRGLQTKTFTNFTSPIPPSTTTRLPRCQLRSTQKV